MGVGDRDYYGGQLYPDKKISELIQMASREAESGERKIRYFVLIMTFDCTVLDLQYNLN